VSTLYVAPHGKLADTTNADVLAAARWVSDAPEDLVDTSRAENLTESRADVRVAILSDGMFGASTRSLIQAHAARTRETIYTHRFPISMLRSMSID